MPIYCSEGCDTLLKNSILSIFSFILSPGGTFFVWKSFIKN